jgi:TonB family protein
VDALIRLSEAWWPLYATHMLEFSLFVSLVWTVDRWTKLDTRLRYGLWLMVLIKAFVPPFYSLPLPAVLATEHLPAFAPIGAFGMPSVKVSVQAVGGPGQVPWTVWAFCLWVFSVTVFAGGTVWRNVRLRRSLASARPVALTGEVAGLRGLHALTVYTAPGLHSPLLIGVFRPRLYLPARWHDWTSEQLRGVVAHEIAHFHSRDIWALVFQALATALYGLNPLVWLAHRQLGHLRELRCDETALRQSGVSPVAYGKLLMDFLDGRSHSTVTATYFTEQGKSLKTRFEHVLNFRGGDMTRSGWRRLVPILVGLAILPLSVRETYTQPQGTKAEAGSTQRASQLLINAKGQLMLDFTMISRPDLDPQFVHWKRARGTQPLDIRVDEAVPKEIVEGIKQDAEKRGISVTVLGPSPVPNEAHLRQRAERFFSDGGPTPGDDGVWDSADLEMGPELIWQEASVYPEAALRERRAGRATVKFKVNVDGSVSDAILLQGEEPFRQAALEAVLQYRFKPGEYNGKPVAVWLTMPFHFQPDPTPSQEAGATGNGGGSDGKAAQLLPNYPNPFNPETTIRYELKKKAFVRLTVYTEAGQEVRALVSLAQLAGQYQVRWNGRDNEGRDVPSGTYHCRLTAGDVKETREMMLLR